MSDLRSSDSLTTRDGVRVEVGQVWRDCDKRMSSGNRKCRVVEVDTEKGKARMQNIHGPVPATWVSVRRMYRHATGWELVP
jgi:hypothetical protein